MNLNWEWNKERNVIEVVKNKFIALTIIMAKCINEFKNTIANVNDMLYSNPL